MAERSKSGSVETPLMIFTHIMEYFKEREWRQDRKYEKGVKALAQFFALKIYYGDFELNGRLSPGGPIDAQWHALLLRPCLYAGLFDGQIIDHDPKTAGDRMAVNQRYRRTRRLALHHFNGVDTRIYWKKIANSELCSGMQLFVKGISGKTHTFCGDFNSATLVEDFYELVAERLKLTTVDEIRMIYSGHILERGRTLADNNIQKDVTLHLTYNLRGC